MLQGYTSNCLGLCLGLGLQFGFGSGLGFCLVMFGLTLRICGIFLYADIDLELGIEQEIRTK